MGIKLHRHWFGSIGFSVMFLCTLIACSGGGGGSCDDRVSGIFIDSPVEGLSYETSQHKVVGITNSEGRFLYYPGESINFYIGDLWLGEAPAKKHMNPLDLFPQAKNERDQRVTNMCRLLQSLDEDGDPENGIYLSEQICNEVSGRPIDFGLSVEEFENDPDVQALFVSLNETGVFMAGDAELPETRSLRTAEEAQAHLLNSLDDYIDADDDGFTVSEGDCDDSNPDASPVGDEICGDGVDQDCDGKDAICEG